MTDVTAILQCDTEMHKNFDYSVGDVVDDVKNRSLTSQSDHYHKPSPTTVTNIDVAESYLHA